MTKTAYRDHFQIFPINKNNRKWPVEFSLPQDHPFPTQQLEKTLVRYLHFNNNIFTVEFLCAGFYPSTFVYSRFSSKIQFLYCLLSSLAPWGGPMVDTEGKIFQI